MANNLYQQLTNNTSILKSMSNPQALLMNLANKNPMVANIMQEVKANGGDAKALFYKKANEMGVNPNDILNQLR